MSFLKFLGTAGARFVMIHQLRSSGGLWLSYKGTNLIIDPGPGCLVRCHKSKPKLEPAVIDGIIITHKHLDHSGDVNVMIEAMTEGGFKKRGTLFVPADALDHNGVVFHYLMSHPEKIEILKPGDFSIGEIRFTIPGKNIHSVETYGMIFKLGEIKIGLVSDTKYFDQLVDFYQQCDILILNVVFMEPRSEYEHLSLPEALYLVKQIKPKKAIFTHFGTNILKSHPKELEKQMRQESGLDIVFARDGMSLNLLALSTTDDASMV